MENLKNRVTRMIMDSDIVYVDGMTIKNKHHTPNHSNIEEVMENIDKYYVTYFNRDLQNGERCLKLNSEYIL